jgi:thiol-disulfide isomerase/thioredoxin
MAALTAAVAVLVAYRAPVAGSTASEVGPRLDADGNYEREQTPPAAVLTEDGRLVLLSNETASAAHLLVFLSPGCGPCERIGPDLGDWAEQLAPVVVRAVIMAQPQSAAAMPYLAGHAWYDPYGIARTAFGVATPGAVLLGTDGLLAGGPVQGEDDVRSFVAEVAEHLSEALEAAGPEGVSDAR